MSTEDQHPEVQTAMLGECDRVFVDKGVSGMKASRPEFDQMLAYLRPGDVLVTVRLDRLGRSVHHLVELIKDLGERKVDLVVLQQGIDTTTPAGKLLFHMLAAVAEFEHDLVVERTRDGLGSARAQGHVGGRPAVVDRDKLDITLARKARGESCAAIAKALGVGRSTLYRALQEA